MSTFLGLIAQGGFNGGHMGGLGWLAITVMGVMMGAMGWMIWSMMRGTRGTGGDVPTGEDPVEVLKVRYARGELSTEEFQERLLAMESVRR